MNQPEKNLMLDGVLISRLIHEVRDVFHAVERQIPQDAPQGTVVFLGQLLVEDSEVAYDTIEERWYPLDYTPILRRQGEYIALIAQAGVVDPKPSNPFINLVLAIVTMLSIQLTGALYETGGFPTTLAEWATGFPMMMAMTSILMAHEFGHYFAARYHKVAVTLPYFIPLPPPISPVGTLGAFIQLRSPFKTKKQLFDIGVAGPIGGLIFALPLTVWGVAMSPINELTRQGTSFLEGNSLFYLSLKYIIHGQLLPSFDAYADLPLWQEFTYLLIGSLPPGGGEDILINSFTMAAWFGLFVTAMNLLPVGQLDGGHLIYCLLGENARWLGLSLVGVMVVAGFVSWPGWLLWAGLVFFVIGVGHPPPLNDLVELDSNRKLLAYVMIGVFVLLFMPNPLQIL